MARHLNELTGCGAPWGACPEIDPAAVLRRVEDTLDASPAERNKPMTKKLRFPLVLAAALVLLTVTALALVPTLRELITTDLGPKAPYATELFIGIEDLGIEIDAQAALTDGRMTRLYFTVQDPTGVFFLEDTQNDLYVDFLSGGERVWSDSGRGVQDPIELLSYDAETQTGLYVYCTGPIGYEGTTPPALTHARLTMSYFLPGFRCCGARFSGPMPFGRPNLPLDTLETTTEHGAVVLLPDQTVCTLGEECPEVYISSMGFDHEGRYHIRLHADANVVNLYVTDDPGGPPFWVAYDLFSPDGSTHETHDNAIVTRVSDGWDYCMTDLTRDTYERVGLVFVDADYSVAGGYQMGNWNWTVPLESVEARTAVPAEPLILSRTKDDPPPSGQSHEAQVVSVSVSSLSVAADFTRPENYHLCADVDGYATACTVTFADGSTLEPAFFREAWSGSGWVMWEFSQPIDPEQVVSVSLNGNEVPFP